MKKILIQCVNKSQIQPDANISKSSEDQKLILIKNNNLCVYILRAYAQCIAHTGQQVKQNRTEQIFIKKNVKRTTADRPKYF